MWKTKLGSDAIAFKQAILPFADKYIIERVTVRDYDDRGRVENITKPEYITAAIIPSGSRSGELDSNGFGRRQNAGYGIYAFLPQYFEMGDVIYHPIWGRMRVTSIDDSRYQGVISGTLQRTGTTESSKSYGNKVYEQDEEEYV